MARKPKPKTVKISERQYDIGDRLRIESPHKRPDVGSMVSAPTRYNRNAQTFVVKRAGKRLAVGDLWCLYRLEDVEGNIMPRWAKKSEFIGTPKAAAAECIKLYGKG